MSRPIHQVGDVILDTYEVQDIFYGGGMGIVYKAHHLQWGIHVAIKEPRAEFFDTPQKVEVFEREAHNWITLGLHPNVVTCYYVRLIDGAPRTVSEFIDGGSLADAIRNKSLYIGSDKEVHARILDIAIQFARGLMHAHDNGLIHQDVKPGNLLMTTNGVAKVSDFGLAGAGKASTAGRSHFGKAGCRTLVVEGAGYITPEYASPEQVSGSPLSRASDIWSWGVSVLEMLKGGVDWVTGQAAPFVLDDYFADRTSSDPLAILLGACFVRDPRMRPRSFAEILPHLLQIYLSYTGEPYPRPLPKPEAQSSDVLNNRAISLLDLGKVYRDAQTGQLGADDVFQQLAQSDKIHIMGRLNRILMKWREMRATVPQTSRALENELKVPGFATLIDSAWLESFYRETLQVDSPHIRRTGKGSALIQLHQRVKDHMRRFFYLSDERISKAARGMKEACEAAGGEMRFSSFETNVVAWCGNREARVWRNGDEVLILEPAPESNSHYRNAAISEHGTAFAVLIHEDPAKWTTIRDDYPWHIEIYKMENGTQPTILPTQHRLRGNVVAITLTDDGSQVRVWMYTPLECPLCCMVFSQVGPAAWSNVGFEEQLILTQSHLPLICSSGDGTTLMLAEGGRLQLWNTRNSYLINQVCDMLLSDFGLIDLRDNLPGFDLDIGFEFEVNTENMYDVHTAIRELLPTVRTPYLVAHPHTPEQLQCEEQRLDMLLRQCANECGSGRLEAGIGAIDEAFALSCANKALLLDMRHSLVARQSSNNRFIERCWHSTTTETSEVETYSIQPSSSGVMQLYRLGRIDDVYAATGQPTGEDFQLPSVTNDNSPSLCAFSRLSDQSALCVLEGSFVALLEIRRSSEPAADVVWQLPLAKTFFLSDLHQNLVRVGQALVMRGSEHEIRAHCVFTGSCLWRLSVPDEISIIEQVCYNDQPCVGVGTKNTGEVFIFSETGTLVKHAMPEGILQCSVDSISLFGTKAVISRTHGSIWLFDLANMRTSCLWRCGDISTPMGQSRFNTERGRPRYLERPWAMRLEPSGRGLAYLYSCCELVLLDLVNMNTVLEWECAPSPILHPSFDWSGRWLHFLHHRSKHETFEIMWNIARCSSEGKCDDVHYWN